MTAATIRPTMPASAAGGRTAAVPKLAFAGFAAVTCVGLAGIGGAVFPLIFVVAAVTTALVAYFRAPTRYIQFVYTLWFFTPWVRRVIDYHDGFRTTNLVLVAPTLVTLVAVLTSIRRLRELRGGIMYPFLFTLVGVGYAYGIGVLKIGFIPATYALLTWLGPISLSMHLILNWRDFPALRDAFLSFLQWTLPVVGLYGIYQVVVLPPWDRYWMVAAEVFSIGPPIPFAFRAFGTLNTPGPYSVVLLVGILFLLGSPRRGTLIGLLVCAVSLLLTRTRASWVALLVGLLVVQFMGPVRRMARNWTYLLVIVVLAVPVMSLDVFRESIFSRIASLAALGEDNSARQRLIIASAATQAIGARAEGEGLGATGGAAKLGSADGRQASIDNGFLELFFVLGWPGGSMVLLGLIGQVLTLARFRDSREDAFANSARATVWSLLSVLLIGDIFSGSIGAVFWGAYGFACAAHAYNFAAGRGLRSRQLLREFGARQPAAATP